MNIQNDKENHASDPLGLGKLDSIQPDFDGWSDIESVLKDHQKYKSHWQKPAGWLAVAACLVLVVALGLRGIDSNQLTDQSSDQSIATNLPQAATTSENAASLTVNDATANSNSNSEDANTIASLIGLSNKMQIQVGQMREQTASMPAESAMYVAELEDLIAQVDNELSYTPDSIDLWGQRVNLLLDLAQIYQQQWQSDHGRMALL